MAEAKEQPIIIKKKISGGGHHGGAWKVAYADFVTAMMALFIVLWLLSSSEQVKKAVGGYFSDPSGAGKMMGSTLSGTGENVPISQDNMENLKEKLEEAMKKAPDFQKFKDNIQMTVTGEGLRIELLEKEGGMFFQSGKPDPSDMGSELFKKLAGELAKLPNNIIVEGHTDSKPYNSDNGYSNWELSADRANSTRRLMTDSGLKEHQVVQVRGFADVRLRKKDEPTHPSNRRVSIIVQYLKVSAEEAKAEGAKGEMMTDKHGKAAEHGKPGTQESPGGHNKSSPSGEKKGH